jgi:hypothetical protein
MAGTTLAGEIAMSDASVNRMLTDRLRENAHMAALRSSSTT